MVNSSLFKLANFREDSRKNIFAFESDVMDLVASAAINKSNRNYISTLPQTIIPENYLQDQIDVWNSILKRKDEVEKFFSDIYVSRDFQDSVSTTIPVFDVGEIKMIRPQYLKQYLTNAIKVINDAVNGKDVDIDKICSEKVLDTLKKNLVSKKSLDYISEKDFLTFDNRQVVTVTSSYITSTLLPFIRSSEHEKEAVIKTSNNLLEVVENGIETLNDVRTAFNSIVKEKKLETIQEVLVLITTVTNNFLYASRYVISCLMRKIYLYTANMKEYCTLKDQLMNSFQNGADILHESVLDGNYDFRDEDIVVSMLNGRTDITDSIIDRIFSKFRNYLSENQDREIGDDLHSLIDVQIENAPFDIQLYKLLFGTEQTIYDMIKKMKTSSSDPDLSIEEIQDACGLNRSILETFSDTLIRIQNTTMYVSDHMSMYDICMCVLNELQYAKKFFEKFNSNIKGIYREFYDLKKDIQMNDNDEYSNHERNAEEILFMTSFEKDFRQLLLQIGRAYMDRLRSLEDILVNNEDTISDDENVITPEDSCYTDDYISDALNANEDINTSIIESTSAFTLNAFEKMLMESTTVADPIIFFEAEQPAQQNQNNNGNNNNNNQKQNQNNQNNSNQNNNQSNQKSSGPTVTDNSGSGDSSGGKKGFVGIIEKIKNFISGLIDKLKSALSKGKSNIKWLDQWEQPLKSRSYSNVQIDNLTPYDEKADYIKLINDCANTINGWKANPVGLTEEAVAGKMLASLPRAVKKQKDIKWNEALSNALRYGNGKVGQGITLANGNLSGQVAKMIDYCRKYYSSFDTDMQNATNNINKALEGLENKEVKNNNQNGGMNAEQTFTFMATTTTTLVGVIANVARDRANEYMKVLQQLTPKQKKDNNNNQNNNQNNSEEFNS